MLLVDVRGGIFVKEDKSKLILSHLNPFFISQLDIKFSIVIIILDFLNFEIKIIDKRQ